jgi:ABC-type branched-subunit amino acid transport system substrate-binding protein
MDFNNTDPTYIAFYDKYLEYYGQEPEMVAINAYDMTYIFKAAVEEVGNMNVEELKESILDSEIEGINSTYYIDEFGDNLREHIELVIINGEFAELD